MPTTEPCTRRVVAQQCAAEGHGHLYAVSYLRVTKPLTHVCAICAVWHVGHGGKPFLLATRYAVGKATLVPVPRAHWRRRGYKCDNAMLAMVQ